MPRIIAGRWRGRTLQTPQGHQTRPTADRVKEAVFSSIHDRLEGAYFLDVCSGSGSVGLEALSRGAIRADLVEPKRQAADVIQHNIDQLEADGAHLHRKTLAQALPALEYLQHEGIVPAGYRFIFLDPPYQQGQRFGKRLAEAIEAQGLLEEGGMLIQEIDDKDPSYDYTPYGLELERRKRYGNTTVLYYQQIRPQDEAGRNAP